VWGPIGAEGCKCEDEETGDVEIKLFDAVDLHTPGEPPKPESQADKEPLLTERALELKAWRVGTGISLLVNVGLIIGLLSVLIPQEIRSHSSSSGTCISGTCLREKCSYVRLSSHEHVYTYSKNRQKQWNLSD
jgi:hypothetical protein